MTTLREAAQQALEALENIDKAMPFPVGKQAITALREALEQPKKEPVAFYHPHKGFYWAKPTYISAPTVVDVPPLPLYTAPPAAQPVQRKPLTEEDLRKLADKHLFYQPEGYEVSGIYNLARAIEAAHGIKEQS